MGILYYVLPVLVLIVVLKILALPLKLIKAIIINSILGGIVLFLLTLIGVTIALSWWGYVLIGLFGVPGVIVLLILNVIL